MSETITGAKPGAASEGAGADEEESGGQDPLGEVERLKVRLAETEERARMLEVRSIRASAAAQHGLPRDLHEFITAEDEAGALEQAEKLAKLKAGSETAPALPPAGGRNPANAGDQAAKRDEQQRFDGLRARVPALNQRVLRR